MYKRGTLLMFRVSPLKPSWNESFKRKSELGLKQKRKTFFKLCLLQSLEMQKNPSEISSL